MVNPMPDIVYYGVVTLIVFGLFCCSIYVLYIDKGVE